MPNKLINAIVLNEINDIIIRKYHLCNYGN